MSIHPAALLVAVLGVAFIAGCDSVPSSDDPLARAPVISDLTYSPESVAPSATEPGQETLDVPVSISVRASGPVDELREVAYVIQPPNPAGPPVALGSLTHGGGGVYAANVTAQIPRGNVGKYTVTVFAVSHSGRLSNTLRGHINYVADGGPPVILEILADPDTIYVSRHNILVLTAVVDDPDGLENISRVVLVTPNQQELPMSDDGVSRGDPVAGDGRYTARFEGVSQASPNTTQVFTFQAFDRTGLSSEVVEKAIRIEE